MSAGLETIDVKTTTLRIVWKLVKHVQLEICLATLPITAKIAKSFCPKPSSNATADFQVIEIRQKVRCTQVTSFNCLIKQQFQQLNSILSIFSCPLHKSGLKLDYNILTI